MEASKRDPERRGYRLKFIDTVSRCKVATMTFYAKDRSQAVMKAYDHAGDRGWNDISVEEAER